MDDVLPFCAGTPHEAAERVDPGSDGCQSSQPVSAGRGAGASPGRWPQPIWAHGHARRPRTPTSGTPPVRPDPSTCRPSRGSGEQGTPLVAATIDGDRHEGHPRAYATCSSIRRGSAGPVTRGRWGRGPPKPSRPTEDWLLSIGTS